MEAGIIMDGGDGIIKDLRKLMRELNALTGKPPVFRDMSANGRAVNVIKYDESPNDVVVEREVKTSKSRPIFWHPA
jgi:hypothetical protein